MKRPDGNRGIRREGRITWRSGNEKWEVMKTDKKERWRESGEREREIKKERQQAVAV